MWRLALSALLAAGCTYSPQPLPAGGDREGDGGDAAGCEPPSEPCASAGVSCGSLRVVDSCGRQVDVACGDCTFPDTCGGDGTPGQCGHLPWFPFGESEFAPHATRVVWGSASGGGITGTKLRDDSPQIEVDSLDRPVVSWEHDGKLRLARWDGAGSWQGLGGSLTEIVSSYVFESCLALDSSDNPMVAWRASDLGGADQIFLRRWDGAVWASVGASGDGVGVSASTGGARGPALAVGTDDQPVLAWYEPPFTSQRTIRMKRFDGNTWVEEQGSSTTGIDGTVADSTSPSVTVDATNRVTVAWVEGPVPSGIHVRQSGVDGWLELDGSATGAGLADGVNTSYAPTIVADPDGHFTVAWASSGTAGNWVAVEHHELAWTELNGSSTMPGVALGLNPALAVDDGGYPVVASASSANRRVDVLRWNGTVWDALGTGLGSNAHGAPVSAAIALDSGGEPVVAWRADPEGLNLTEIWVARWDGNVWQEYGTPSGLPNSISSDPALSWSPAVAMADVLHPVVAWQSTVGDMTSTYLRQWNGSAWVELGDSASGGGISSATPRAERPVVALDGLGRPVVAWTAKGNPIDGVDVYVRHWNGSGWEALGESYSPGGLSVDGAVASPPSLALDASGHPFVAWSHNDGMGVGQIYLKYWTGTSWQELGGSATDRGLSNSTDPCREPRLVLDSTGKPVVAWTADVSGIGQIYLARWDGMAWIGHSGSDTGGGVSATTHYSALPALALDGSGRPIVAWRESAVPNQILVRHWTGSSWQDLGAVCTNSSPGFSVEGRLAPELITDGGGAPIVVWRSEAGVSTEIFARRWQEGVGWQEIAGSASNGGISNSSANSFVPAVARSGDRMCVAWAEAGRPAVEILMRCTDL